MSAAGPAKPAVRGRWLLLAAGLVVVLGLTVAAGPSHSKPASAVAVENQRAGTRGWLGPLANARAAEVYASASDAVAGDTIDVHVSATPSAHYRLLVYRLGWYGGVGARRLLCLPSCGSGETAVSQPIPAPDSSGYVNPSWPATDHFSIGSDWVSGYYLVRALLLDGPEAGRSATTYLVVRQPRSSSAMLVQVPVNTWEAYNGWGGKSLYPFSSTDSRQAIKVSFDRPFAWSLPGGQGPLGWELPLVRFLERTGYDVSYQSDVYTSFHPHTLFRHNVVVVAGHDEYWTHRMRVAFDAARDSGVNLAFMGANAAYWQIRYQDRGRSIFAYKGMFDPNPDTSLKTAMFRELIPPDLECALIGVQHQGVGLQWPPGDYTVAPTAVASPWLRGTGLHPGDVVRGVVSVESDSIPGDQSAASACGNRLTVLFHREHGGDKDGNADSTVYTTPGGARVFASGSHQFSWALDDFAADPDEGHGFADLRVQRFMQNAFADLTR